MPPKKEHERRSSIATSQIDDSNRTATTPKQSKEPISLLSAGNKSEMESCGVGPNSSLQPGQSTITGTEHQETGIIARLCRVTLESLAFLVRSSVLTTTARNKNILRRCHATLKLWMNGHRIWTGELDRALEVSENLKHTTLSVLHSLCVSLLTGLKTHLKTSPDDAVAVQLLNGTTDACSHARLLLSDFYQPTSDTDSSDDDVFDDGHHTNGTDRVAEKIKMYTHCLLDLSAALECPALDAAQMNHAVAQPQHSSLPSAEKADVTLHSSADLTKLWGQPPQLPWKVDDQLSPWLDADFKEPIDWNSLSGLPSYPKSRPLEVPTSATVTKPTSDTKPGWVRTRIEDVTRTMGEMAGALQSKRSFQCPFRKAQSKAGLPYTCTSSPVSTVSAVRAHLTRNLPKGTPPHLPFLKLCRTCNDDILDDVEFETRHGVDGMKCETPRQQRKGVAGQQEQYDLLCSKVEAYIAAQEAQKARPANDLDIAPGPSMTSQAEDEIAKGHSSSSDRDHVSMHPTMAENDSWKPRHKHRRSITQWTSDSGKAGDSDFSDFRLTSEQGPLPTPNHEWVTPDSQVPGGFFEALDDEELGNQRQDSTLIPDIGSSRHLSEPGTTTRQPEDGPTSSSTVPKSLPCDVEGCDARFFVGMDEELARKHHNHRFHQNLHSDQSRIRRSHSPRVTGGEKYGDPSETPDRL